MARIWRWVSNNAQQEFVSLALLRNQRTSGGGRRQVGRDEVLVSQDHGKSGGPKFSPAVARKNDSWEIEVFPRDVAVDVKFIFARRGRVPPLNAEKLAGRLLFVRLCSTCRTHPVQGNNKRKGQRSKSKRNKERRVRYLVQAFARERRRLSNRGTSTNPAP